jgi:hypothetical protein
MCGASPADRASACGRREQTKAVGSIARGRQLCLMLGLPVSREALLRPRDAVVEQQGPTRLEVMAQAAQGLLILRLLHPDDPAAAEEDELVGWRSGAPVTLPAEPQPDQE